MIRVWCVVCGVCGVWCVRVCGVCGSVLARRTKQWWVVTVPRAQQIVDLGGGLLEQLLGFVDLLRGKQLEHEHRQVHFLGGQQD
mgnify:CR=1 FL=1